ncbi:dipeptidase PepE [Chitinophaga sancti]|uniref:Dipeptidase E n=1 Tax=Chitinophaga sancti TaxID=1004 RepID=A0A1K1MRI5_9BACT|nr:dipeptidase PepE [Chitinophaga sancti]WQD62829.1 dipeptidase PepE [Chitinophaga sancti]WQG91547.1 dipeptidase PepE [Chitinophaga sancti]SFW24574.1 dipeptidase E [Chitinophaga sancti]
MKNVVLASTSTLYGEKYLQYLLPVMQELFAGIDEIVFIPYARPGGISHDEYTARAAAGLANIGIRVKGLHTFADPAQAIREAKGFFTGGGNTFVLVKQLHELKLMDLLSEVVAKGTPYIGASAGSNIGGVNMQTTNDMPIVYPPSFQTMGLMPYNINPHYQEPIPGVPHMGETRETRILEFHTQQAIPVIGLREGSWIRIKGDEIRLQGSMPAKIFEQGKTPYELPAGADIKI